MLSFFFTLRESARSGKLAAARYRRATDERGLKVKNDLFPLDHRSGRERERVSEARCGFNSKLGKRISREMRSRFSPPELSTVQPTSM